MALTLTQPLLLVGAGKMGGAMLAGWLENGIDPAQVMVLDPSPPQEVMTLLDKHNIATVASANDIIATRPTPGVIVMAVKPQMMEKVYPPVARLAGRDTVVFSVAAGSRIASFEAHLAPNFAVVRAMPNTPAAIGRGMIVCCANAATSAAQRDLCTQLAGAVGEVGWIEDEDQIDAVTAVSGAGPAYVFLLAECLAEAGIAAGLDTEFARRIARQTVSGAGELLHRSHEDAATLRANVTSPGGVTAAALAVLMAHDNTDEQADNCNMKDLMIKAIAAGTQRGRELG